MKLVVAAVLLSAPVAASLASVPVIPDQWYAVINATTVSTVGAIPSGTEVIKEWYDYKNKMLRKDFDTGVTKVYDYKTLVDPGMEKPGGPGNNPRFPSPQGFKYRTDDIKVRVRRLDLVGKVACPSACLLTSACHCVLLANFLHTGNVLLDLVGW